MTPVVYTYIARDHQKARLALEAEETAGQGLDAKAGAGILFPGEAKPAPSGPDASTGKGRGRLPTAAE